MKGWMRRWKIYRNDNKNCPQEGDGKSRSSRAWFHLVTGRLFQSINMCDLSQRLYSPIASQMFRVVINVNNCD